MFYCTSATVVPVVLSTSPPLPVCCLPCRCWAVVCHAILWCCPPHRCCLHTACHVTIGRLHVVLHHCHHMLVVSLLPPPPAHYLSCCHQVVACHAARCCYLPPPYHHWVVACRVAVCCCLHHCCYCCPAAHCVAVEQLCVVQWCATAHAAAMVLIVLLSCGCHHHGGCHWVVPAHTI